jgi:hypothetical protein
MRYPRLLQSLGAANADQRPNEELFDYGANQQAALDYIDMADWSDLRAAAQVN